MIDCIIVDLVFILSPFHLCSESWIMIDCIIADLNILQRITINCIKDLVFFLSPFHLCSGSWIMIDCTMVDLNILQWIMIACTIDLDFFRPVMIACTINLVFFRCTRFGPVELCSGSWFYAVDQTALIGRIIHHDGFFSVLELCSGSWFLQNYAVDRAVDQNCAVDQELCRRITWSTA